MNSNHQGIPTGVRGIDLGEIVVMLAADKLIINEKRAPRHLTVHLGPNSGELDIHRTEQSPGGASVHTRLFAISHANFRAMIQEIGPTVVTRLTDIWRPLRPGWMMRNRIGAVVGLLPPESDFEKVTGVRKKRVLVDAEKLKANVRRPDFLHELYDQYDEEGFTVLACENACAPRALGFGLKRTDILGRPRLIWIKNRDVTRAFKRIEDLLFATARKYGAMHVEPPWL